jgi:hypothetical protein
MNHASDAAHFRELAAKCRRFAGIMSQANAAAFRQMAADYEFLANKDAAAHDRLLGP